MGNINKHIQDYLEYYYLFDQEPEYAVLLKGKWGTGKTWFIKKTLQNLTDKGGKHLYISLYGISSYDEIESEFFKQLHPLLSSKSMALTGKIAKGLLKTTLKIDFDDDGKSDGSISVQTPNINLPEYLTNTSDFVLIFDDLERASISLENILGYINHFVEHQGYKVVIIANEEEILSQQQHKEKTELTYRRIKEKLIGKTFEVSPDLFDALDNFISGISCESIRDLYTSNINLVAEYYELSLYRNLRHLKQALWEFERLADYLTEEAKEKNGLLEHLLKTFLILSFEIKSGNILPEDIKLLRSGFYSGLLKKDSSDKEETKYQKISKKYKNISIYELLLEDSIWVDIFDKGKISKDAIQESLDKSDYFKSDNTPDWVRLWHAMDLNDDEFIQYLNSVTSDFESMKFEEIGIVKHITGVLLWLSEIKLYNKTKKEILDTAKTYIDHLKKKGILSNTKKGFHRFRENESWGGLCFHCSDSEEFKYFCKYIESKEDEATIESYPELGNDLLKLIGDDPQLFYRKVTHCNHEDNLYYETPIFHYIEPVKFVDAFFNADPESKRTVCYAFSERYKFNSFNESLKEELSWLFDVTKLLEEKVDTLNGKISGYQLKSMIDTYFKQAINTLNNYEANK